MEYNKYLYLHYFFFKCVCMNVLQYIFLFLLQSHTYDFALVEVQKNEMQCFKRNDNEMNGLVKKVLSLRSQIFANAFRSDLSNQHSAFAFIRSRIYISYHNDVAQWSFQLV